VGYCKDAAGTKLQQVYSYVRVLIMYREGGILTVIMGKWGTRWRSWLRCCATSRKVAGSIPNGVNDIILQPHYGPGVDSASNRMSTRNIPWGVKAAGAHG
jgi:hypothetical protein